MPKPMVQAAIVCDYLYQDKSTGKTVLSGTFSSIRATRLPAKHGNLALYIALTDVSESGKVNIVLKSLDDDAVSYSLPTWNVTVNPVKARLQTIELGANYAGLSFPVAGLYEFSVYWNETYLIGKKVSVELLTEEKGE